MMHLPWITFILYLERMSFGSSVCCGGVAVTSNDKLWTNLYMTCIEIDDRCCGDCSSGTPYCGYGSCNIFGCDCDNGCRSGECGSDAPDRRRLYNDININLDNKLSLNQTIQWLSSNNMNLNISEIRSEFSKFDLNNDGFLSLNEFNKCDTNNTSKYHHSKQSRLLLSDELDYENWMSQISDSVEINKLSIPGTHDTISWHYDYDTIFDAEWTMTQGWSLLQNLNAGVRVLDLRCRHINNIFTMHHGPIYLDTNLGDVLDELESWLQIHPKETILARFKLNEHDPDGNTQTEEETFKGYTEKYPIFWNEFDTSTSAPIPILGDVRGKVVILQNFDSKDKQYGIKYENDNKYMHIQDEWTKTGDDKWNAIQDKINNAVDGKLNINYISASNFPRLDSPLDNAKELNPRLYSYIDDTSNINYVGIPMMDFPSQPLIRKIIKLNGDFFQ